MNTILSKILQFIQFAVFHWLLYKLAADSIRMLSSFTLMRGENNSEFYVLIFVIYMGFFSGAGAVRGDFDRPHMKRLTYGCFLLAGIGFLVYKILYGVAARDDEALQLIMVLSIGFTGIVMTIACAGSLLLLGSKDTIQANRHMI